MGPMPPPPGMPPPGPEGMPPEMAGAPPPEFMQPPMDPPMPPPELIKEALEQILGMIEYEADQMTKPLYPRWYRATDYPKPKAEDALAEARRLWAEFGSYRRRVMEDLKFIRGQDPGHFAEFGEDEDEEQFYDATAAADIEFAATQLASLDPRYKIDVRQLADRNEAADKLDFLYACDDDADRKHTRRGSTPRKLDIARTLLQYGRVCQRTIFDLDCDEDEMPFREHLIDPTTCAPLYDDRGMRRMVRIYRMTVAEVMSTFEHPDGRIEQTIKGNKRQDHDVVEVTEYWDRRWYLVWVQGDVVVQGEHQLGFVPFDYQMGGLGAPSYIQETAEVPIGQLRVMNHSPGDAALPHKGVSYIHFMRTPHKQKEALMSTLITAVRRNEKPPLLVEQDMIAAEKGVPEIDRTSGTSSSVMAGQESVKEIPANPASPALMPVVQTINEALGRTQNQAAAYGINANSNVTGFALETLNEAGRHLLMPHMQALENYYQSVAEKRLRIFRDWGYVLGQEEGQLGFIMVPRDHALSGDDPWFKLTPGDVRRTGIRVQAHLNSLTLRGMAPVVNMVGQLMQMQLMTRRDALEHLDYSRNVDRTLAELELEEAMQDPVLKESELIRFLQSQGEVSLAAYFQARKMAGDQGQGGPPQGGPPGGPPQGGPPGGPGGGPGGPPTTDGMSLPMMNPGMAPGSNGAPTGRPPTPPGYGPPGTEP